MNEPGPFSRLPIGDEVGIAILIVASVGVGIAAAAVAALLDGFMDGHSLFEQQQSVVPRQARR